jgi:hypothetical protein
MHRRRGDRVATGLVGGPQIERQVRPRATREKEDGVFRRVILVILVVLAVIALVGALGAGFHHAGYWGPGGRMMRFGPGYGGYGGGWGFFPGLFLVPLFLLLILGLVFWRPWHHHFWRYGYGPGPYGQGPQGQGPYGPGGPRQMFEEWHRQAHGGDPNAPGTTPPAGGQTWPDGPGYGPAPAPGQGFVPGQGAPTPPAGGPASPPPVEPPTPPTAPEGGGSAS